MHFTNLNANKMFFNNVKDESPKLSYLNEYKHLPLIALPISVISIPLQTGL